MAFEGSAWVDPDAHGWIRSPADDAAWNVLVDDYGGDPVVVGPFKRLLEVVRANGCVSVVIENRYVDPDYRSEYGAFWANRFVNLPAFARRLHFFTTAITDDDLHDLPQAAVEGYLGYAVVRPVPMGALGRTVVSPPPEMVGSVVTAIDDQVTLFGNRLVASGAPFSQQDTEYLRCAHAAAWMCHYTAARRGLVGRRLTAAFADASPSLLSLHRALPSKGLSPHQVQAIFGTFGQPALALDFNQLPKVQGVTDPAPQQAPGGTWDTRMFSIICRYLNSGFPVFIGTKDHAFTVVGWRRDAGEIRFFVNDDARGPYLRIDSPFTDVDRAPWLLMMVPLPPRVFLSAESAENVAYTTLRNLAAVPGASAPLATLAAGIASGAVGLRTFLLDGSDYKAELAHRGVDAGITKLLRLARLPHYVWVVEAHDTSRCSTDNPCVVGEVVLDSTSHDNRPRHDAVIGPGFGVTFPPYGQPTGAANGTRWWRSHLDQAAAGH